MYKASLARASPGCRLFDACGRVWRSQVRVRREAINIGTSLSWTRFRKPIRQIRTGKNFSKVRSAPRPRAFRARSTLLTGPRLNLRSNEITQHYTRAKKCVCAYFGPEEYAELRGRKRCSMRVAQNRDARNIRFAKPSMVAQRTRMAESSSKPRQRVQRG